MLAYLSLTMQGVPVGGGQSIECLSYRDAVARAPMPGDAVTLAHDLTYDPLMIRKRIDWSSAVLERVLTQNEIVEGTFGLFRTSVDGNEERLFRTKIVEARIASIIRFVPEMPAGSATHVEPLEEVAFVFKSIATTWDIKPPAPLADSWQTGQPGSAPQGAAPGPPPRLVTERRPPSRVAVVAPLTEAPAADLERWRTA